MRRLSLLLSLVVACGGPAATAAPAVVLDEYTVDAPGRWRAERLSLSVENDGEVPHTLVVSDEEGRPVAASELIGPGEEAVLTVDLAPGRYVVSCRIVVARPDGTLSDHFAAGMFRSIDVG